MNAVFSDLGLAPWKAVLTALVLPPVPFLLLALWGAALLWARRAAGWLLIFLSVAGLWLSASDGTAQALSALLLKPPGALGPVAIEALVQGARSRKTTAIVVLGGGREAYAPEYRTSSLSPFSLERLRYGLWLARETGLPVAFSGGVGWAQAEGLSEAQIAARIAAAEFGRPLRWTEDESRDTRENARRTLALLRASNIDTIVLVTHGWHMLRALRAFGEAAQDGIRIIPAPMALAPRIDRPALLWLPTGEGSTHVRQVLRESLGLLLGS